MNKELGEIYNNLMLYKSKEDLALNVMELTADKMVLENNWNELKEWMNSEMERFEDNPYTRLGIAAFTKVLCKMQEIEGGVDNE